MNTKLIVLLSGLLLLSSTTQGEEQEGLPSESECRPYIEKALQGVGTLQNEDKNSSKEDIENTAVSKEDNNISDVKENFVDNGKIEEYDKKNDENEEITSEEKHHLNEDTKSDEDIEENSAKEIESTEEIVEELFTDDNNNEKSIEGEIENLKTEHNEIIEESSEDNKIDVESKLEKEKVSEEIEKQSIEEDNISGEIEKEKLSTEEAEDKVEEGHSNAVEEEEEEVHNEVQEDEEVEAKIESKEEIKESTEEVEEAKESIEEGEEAKESIEEGDEAKESIVVGEEAKESVEVEEAKESVEVEEAKASIEELEEVKESTEEANESTEKVKESKEELEEAKDSTEEAKESTEEAKESAEEAKEEVEAKESIEELEEAKESIEELEETKESTEEAKESKEDAEEAKESTEEAKESKEDAEEAKESNEDAEEAKESKEDAEEAKENKEEIQEAEIESKEIEEVSTEDKVEEKTTTSESKEIEETESEPKIEEEAQSEPQTAEESPIEPPEEEELSMVPEIPENLRSRDHMYQILHLDAETEETEKILSKTVESTLKELKKLYDAAIKPLEVLYKYRDLSNRHFGDPEIFSKPLILFMGPWSGGKSTIINYLLENEYRHTALRTGADPSPAYFNIVMWGDEPEIVDGTQLAADWTFSGLQKFGQGLLDRLRGLKLNHPLLQKVNIVEIPGILEIRKQVERLFPFNDACQWFIDRADIIFLVYDPSKLDIGPETEAILDQLKGREMQTRIILNKADQVKPEELMRVQGTLIWNISPLMSSTEPPIMYSTSLWSVPYENGSPTRLLLAQEKAFLTDLRSAIDKRVENKIAGARRFAVRVRNHAKMVDCYLTTYYNHKSIFDNKKHVSDDIIEHPQNYHIYEGLSTLTNISRYDLPDPETYRDFFRLNPVYEFQQLSATCTYFRGCPINRLDLAIAYDLPELIGKYKKSVEEQLKLHNQEK
ncbi:hypothetical protein O3M35_013217 [Rhynocoris fuscipes]|uniref:Dynamin-type G domain-containing protein n=1 Tax=Rhynocoris fuscipes TaxID=488301 RepID=A0AAW1CEN1_9HEMI